MIQIDESCDQENIGFKYLASVLNHVQIGDYQLWLGETSMGGYYLQIRFDEKDNFGDEVSTQYCRQWLLRVNMSTTEIVRTAYKAYEAAVMHEMQEKFLYHGQSIFNPHRDVDKMLDKTSV